MKIKKTFDSGNTFEVYELTGDSPFISACVSRNKETFGDKWLEWRVSFGSCNGDMEFMEKRYKVITEAYKLARKLNKVTQQKRLAIK